jgi:signal peptidase
MTAAKHATTGTGARDVRRYLGVTGNVLIWVIVAIDAWFLWPMALGGSTSLVIVSGSSMEPTYFQGDLVIARDIEPSIGDVIVYAPEGLGGAQVVHRIIGGDAEAGWELQGDNNDFVDPFTPTADEVRGVVLVHYANLGRLSALVLNPLVWAFVLVIAIGLLLWYSDECEDEDDELDENEQSRDGDDPGTSASAETAELPAVDSDPDRESQPAGVRS